jgi:hypothetical protein
VSFSLLSADEGQAERAVELHSLASRYGFVANSAWFRDIVGGTLTAAAAGLPPGVLRAARARGAALDLDDTIGELLAGRAGQWETLEKISMAGGMDLTTCSGYRIIVAGWIHLAKGAHRMLGRRSPQRSLFDVLVLPHRGAADLFYGRMSSVNDVLFPGDDLAALHFTDNGHPRFPSPKPNQVSKLSENAGLGALFDDLIRGAAKWRPGPTGCQAGSGAHTTS